LTIPATGPAASGDPLDVGSPSELGVGGSQAVIDQIGVAFHGFMRALHALDRPGWGDLDLTMSQLKTIMLLVETEGLTGRDLAEKMGIGPSAVTALVDRLVQRGYVRREEDRADRRVSWARPTSKATELFERLHATHRERLAEVLAGLSSEDLALVAHAILTLERAAARQAGVTPLSGTNC
jgi:DNA-binding MarR family transcriptional regulator